jgi:hypothetical protein
VNENSMHRRFEDRLSTEFDIVVTDLSCESRSGAGQVCDISKSGICATLPVDLAPGSAVRLEIADSTLFGHVVYSNPDGPRFRVGMEVVRVLLGGTDHSRLLQSTLQEEIPDLPGVDGSEVPSTAGAGHVATK